MELPGSNAGRMRSITRHRMEPVTQEPSHDPGPCGLSKARGRRGPPVGIDSSSGAAGRAGQHDRWFRTVEMVELKSLHARAHPSNLAPLCAAAKTQINHGATQATEPLDI